MKEDIPFIGNLDSLATDPDNESSTLRWEAYSLSENIFTAVDDSVGRTLRLTSTKDWSGTGTVVF